MADDLHLDWETKSTVDLKAAGLDNYARHATTDIWCGAWAFGDENYAIWRPGAPCPDRIRRHVESGGLVWGHNVIFEWYLWNYVAVPRYGFPPLHISQCRCTMAMSYAMAMPGALDNAAAAAGINVRKDQAGYRLMLQLCRPREVKPDGTIIWWDTTLPGDKDTGEQRVERLCMYCGQDLNVERELGKRLMPLSDDEQALWVLDYKINQRGIYVDRAAAANAIEIVTVEQDRLNLEMRKVTKNFVGFCTEAARLTKWVQSRGVAVEGIAKADIIDALALPDLPDDVRAALLLRQEAAKSSTAKLRAMTEATSADGRLRGTLQYHGAGTGRWAGRRVQLQNMPRSSISNEEIAEVFEVLK